MTLYLDSAEVEDARRASGLGFVRGVTTNPALMARTGRDPRSVLRDLCDLIDGTVFYQPTATGLEAREDEVRAIADAFPGRVGLKIPCTLENLALASRLVEAGFVIGVTAVFSAAQVHLACHAGVRYVLPYVNRSTRLQGDGLALVEEMRAVIDANGSSVEIIAASVKSPAEAVDTVLAGAHHLTLPLSVIEAMARHELSDQAIAQFGEAWEAARA
jgi:transaldolase